ncbi:MAG: peptidase S8/S53 subtilisin kexin sedolisin [Chlorobi bacterium OLB5]|nr:MAG: peptidase S8/S53 subtilisin kexin sedolisin [Chlorobi bacterium OLB5]
MNDDEAKMKTLEQRSQLGDVNASRELSQMNSLKQVVKTEKPQNILQHVRIISEDIRKVFGEGTSSSKVNPNTLPTVYRLSQNYPNPFNPVTKINYDLPRDAKVTLIIYDILGREVKRLVNNEIKKAGAYIVDFYALNYASGVYFYRIEAEETGGFKFVDSKKMVLLK